MGCVCGRGSVREANVVPLPRWNWPPVCLPRQIRALEWVKYMCIVSRKSCFARRSMKYKKLSQGIGICVETSSTHGTNGSSDILVLCTLQSLRRVYHDHVWQEIGRELLQAMTVCVWKRAIHFPWFAMITSRSWCLLRYWWTWEKKRTFNVGYALLLKKTF